MNQPHDVHGEKHEFAFFVPLFSDIIASVVPQHECIITSEVLVHRLRSVVRLEQGASCIFFDRMTYAHCTVKEFVGKKQIRCMVQSKHATVPLTPRITFLLPLLKRDDYDQAIYALAEIGVTTIQLVITHKSRSSWAGAKDAERAQRIIIAAAEQSKNFAYPYIMDPIPFEQALNGNDNAVKIFFDPTGQGVVSVCQSLLRSHDSSITLCVGPEGDLTHEEKALLRQHGFIECALTPTVLRSVQAVAIGAGIIRSLFCGD